VGDGAVRHADVLHREVGVHASIQAPPLLAAPIGRIALENASSAVLPHAILPIYVRRSDAELARASHVVMMSSDQMADFSISRLRDSDDLADVVALEAASFTNPWSRETLERDLRNTDVVRVFTLRDGVGQLLGFCGCWFVTDELHINTLAVAASERRRGHATRHLLRFVLRRGRGDHGLTRATLEVRRSNDAALRLRTLRVRSRSNPARITARSRSRMRWCCGTENSTFWIPIRNLEARAAL
jgi:ribosomal-protein-alanine N-acetyltransferase